MSQNLGNIIGEVLGNMVDTVTPGNVPHIVINKDEVARTITMQVSLHDARDLDTLIVAIRKSTETILGL